MDFIEELSWRGMIHQMMPGTEDQLKKEMTTAYLGIDPTADSLHIGHLVGVMMLKHFQRLRLCMSPLSNLEIYSSMYLSNWSR